MFCNDISFSFLWYPVGVDKSVDSRSSCGAQLQQPCLFTASGVNSSGTPSGICHKSITTKCTQSPRGINTIRENSTKQGCFFDQINATFDTLPIALSYVF